MQRASRGEPVRKGSVIHTFAGVSYLLERFHAKAGMLSFSDIAPEVIAEKSRIYKGVSANVDFYSGFVYSMLEIPLEMYTPIFAIARIVGWSAHRIEELINMDKIIRPAYKSVMQPRDYIELGKR